MSELHNRIRAFLNLPPDGEVGREIVDRVAADYSRRVIHFGPKNAENWLAKETADMLREPDRHKIAKTPLSDEEVIERICRDFCKLDGVDPSPWVNRLAWAKYRREATRHLAAIRAYEEASK